MVKVSDSIVVDKTLRSFASNLLHSLELGQGGMPFARLRLRLPTREGERSYLNQWDEKIKPLVPQFPLAEPAYTLDLSPTDPIKPKGSKYTHTGVSEPFCLTYLQDCFTIRIAI